MLHCKSEYVKKITENSLNTVSNTLKTKGYITHFSDKIKSYLSRKCLTNELPVAGALHGHEFGKSITHALTIRNKSV